MLCSSITGPDDSVTDDFGSSPSYVDLMQESFGRPDEEALLASASYDFAGLGADGLSAIVNFVAGFGDVSDGVRGDAQRDRRDD